MLLLPFSDDIGSGSGGEEQDHEEHDHSGGAQDHEEHDHSGGAQDHEEHHHPGGAQDHEEHHHSGGAQDHEEHHHSGGAQDSDMTEVRTKYPQRQFQNISNGNHNPLKKETVSNG